MAICKRNREVFPEIRTKRCESSSKEFLTELEQKAVEILEIDENERVVGVSGESFLRNIGTKRCGSFWGRLYDKIGT